MTTSRRPRKIAARTATVIGTRKVILEQGTQLWDRQLYQTVWSLLLLVLIGFLSGTDVPAFYIEDGVPTLHLGEYLTASPFRSASWRTMLVVALSCICGSVLAGLRLALLGHIPASSFAIFASLALLPVRVASFGSRYGMLHASGH